MFFFVTEIALRNMEKSSEIYWGLGIISMTKKGDIEASRGSPLSRTTIM
jgi:hypothetical protein